MQSYDLFLVLGPRPLGLMLMRSEQQAVSITWQALLCPLTIVFNPGGELSNKYSVITAMACQRQII